MKRYGHIKIISSKCLHVYCMQWMYKAKYIDRRKIKIVVTAENVERSQLPNPVLFSWSPPAAAPAPRVSCTHITTPVVIDGSCGGRIITGPTQPNAQLLIERYEACVRVSRIGLPAPAHTMRSYDLLKVWKIIGKVTLIYQSSALLVSVSPLFDWMKFRAALKTLRVQVHFVCYLRLVNMGALSLFLTVSSLYFLESWYDVIIISS